MTERGSLVERDLIVFGDDWGHYPSTIQHIGRVLARKNRLLWIGSLGLRRPKVSGYDLLRVLTKGSRMIGARRDPLSVPGVHQLHPTVVPLHDLEPVRRLNMAVLRTSLRKRMRVLNIRRPVILTASPLVGDLIGALGESSAHYVCLDDWTQFDGAFRSLGALEQELLRKVHSCFAVSERLLETRRVAGSENHLLPQGVDTAHFTRGSQPLPAAVAGLRRPVLGFFGLLASFTDLDLLAETARAFPEATVLVIGRQAVDISVLRGIPNLLYIGEVPFDRLPAYAQVFDVGLAPFVVNELTRAANPLKVLEYLSLGLPVVATDLPELHRLAPHVLIGRDRAEFVALVREAVSRAEAGARERRAVAGASSWERIAAVIGDVVVRVEAAT